jgi:hypothetical protein
VLAGLCAEVAADRYGLGLVLHGSRARGAARVDSDYDVIWVVTDAAYAEHKAAGALLEQRHHPKVDILYQSPGRLAEIAKQPDWYTATYLTARILHDPTGMVTAHLAAIRDAANNHAAQALEDRYDAYLTAFARSLKCWRRGDVLGGRLNAAHSVPHLIDVLHAVAGRWTPYVDDLAVTLPDLQAVLDWPGDPLPAMLIQLVSVGDPHYQQRVERWLTDTLSDRGHTYNWTGEFDPPRRWRFHQV